MRGGMFYTVGFPSGHLYGHKSVNFCKSMPILFGDGSQKCVKYISHISQPWVHTGRNVNVKAVFCATLYLSMSNLNNSKKERTEPEEKPRQFFFKVTLSIFACVLAMFSRSLTIWQGLR